MQIRAEQKNSRQSPRKVRLLANQVKKLPLEQAFIQLSLMERKGSLVLIKVLRQAVANATSNHQLQIQDLTIEKILVKTGSTYKRMRAVSRGRGHQILKRTCHVEVVLTTQKIDEVAKQSKTQIAKNKVAETKTQAKEVAAKKTSSTKTTAKTKQATFKNSKQNLSSIAKEGSKIKRQTGLQSPVTKVHRRKTGV